MEESGLVTGKDSEAVSHYRQRGRSLNMCIGYPLAAELQASQQGDMCAHTTSQCNTVLHHGHALFSKTSRSSIILFFVFVIKLTLEFVHIHLHQATWW